MRNPNTPKYYTDFYDKYPEDRHAINELNKDILQEQQRMVIRQQKYLGFATVAVSLYAVLKNRLPFYGKYSRQSSVYTIVKIYFFAGAASFVCATIPCYMKTRIIQNKLQDIDSRRKREEDEQIIARQLLPCPKSI